MKLVTTNFTCKKTCKKDKIIIIIKHKKLQRKHPFYTRYFSSLSFFSLRHLFLGFFSRIAPPLLLLYIVETVSQLNKLKLPQKPKRQYPLFAIFSLTSENGVLKKDNKHELAIKLLPPLHIKKSL